MGLNNKSSIETRKQERYEEMYSWISIYGGLGVDLIQC